MPKSYQLVSSEEWQAMVDRAEVAEGWHEHWRDVAERWKGRAEIAEKSERQLAAVLDQKADREGPVEWADRAKIETVSRYDTDGRLIYQGPLEDAPAFGESETHTRDNAERMIQEPSRPWTYSVPAGFTELVDGGPQRPHESLVWAMFYSAATAARIPSPISWAEDIMFSEWRARWPESE